MFVSDCLGVNQAGHLTIGGLDTVALAQEYGTPVYLVDEDEVRLACRSFKGSIARHYGGKGLAAYAGKALCCKAMCRLVMKEGLGLDVVSGGELHTAKSVGFPPDRIFFHGNNKTPRELLDALEYGVGQIVVDNMDELETLSQMAEANSKRAGILLRIKPGIDAHTHDFVRTGQIDSKFGFALETGEALEAAQKASAMPGLDFKGVHCHIGSQIFDVDPFVLAATVMVDFMGQIKKETGVSLRILDLGGGFGVKYLESHDPAPYDSYMEQVSKAVKSACKANGLEMPYIVIEPGRSIVASAGITLYTVGSVKHIPNVRTFVSIDGGMTDNPRYILYQSQYEALVANKAAQPKSQTVTLAGKCCESGDLLGEGMPLQPVAPGDVVAVLATGAYNYSMASNYNRIPRPPVVFIGGGKSRLAVRRESYEDMAQNDADI